MPFLGVAVVRESHVSLRIYSDVRAIRIVRIEFDRFIVPKYNADTRVFNYTPRRITQEQGR